MDNKMVQERTREVRILHRQKQLGTLYELGLNRQPLFVGVWKNTSFSPRSKQVLFEVGMKLVGKGKLRPVYQKISREYADKYLELNYK